MMNNEISKIHMYVTLLSFYYNVNSFLYLVAHPYVPSTGERTEDYNINFSSDVRQLQCLIYQASPSSYVGKADGLWIFPLYKVFLSENLTKDTNRSLRDVQRYAVVVCWLIMIWDERCEARGVRWSLCPHPAPSCQQLSEPEWSVELLQHSLQAPVSTETSSEAATDQPPDGEHWWLQLSHQNTRTYTTTPLQSSLQSSQKPAPGCSK